MSDDDVLDLEHAARKRLIKHFRETGEGRFLLAAALLRTKSFDRVSLDILPMLRRKGRPEVPRDHDRLLRMALLLDRGQAADPTEAARLIIAQEESAGAGTYDSIVRRLRGKFIEHRLYLTELVAVLRALVEPTPAIRAITAAAKSSAALVAGAFLGREMASLAGAGVSVRVKQSSEHLPDPPGQRVARALELGYGVNSSLTAALHRDDERRRHLARALTAFSLWPRS